MNGSMSDASIDSPERASNVSRSPQGRAEGRPVISFEPSLLEARDRDGCEAPCLVSTSRADSSGSDGRLVHPHASGRSTTILIERRSLIRDCLVKAFEASRAGEIVLVFATVPEAVAALPSWPARPLILLGTSGCDRSETEQEIALLLQTAPTAPVVLLADGEDRECVLGALDKGARGYISTTTPFDVALNAIQLVRAGGTFVPAGSLKAPDRPGASPTSGEAVSTSPFTARQRAVIEALRRGKANKVIAFELNMQESTVKVHVRNIMRKLQAKNRTEVAFRVNAMASL